MQEHTSPEVVELRKRQQALQQQLNQLGQDISRLEFQLTSPRGAASSNPPVVPKPQIEDDLIGSMKPIALETPALRVEEQTTVVEHSTPPATPIPADKSPEKLLSTYCTKCNSAVEFPSLALGDSIPCPRCGTEVLLATSPVRVQPPIVKLPSPIPPVQKLVPIEEPQSDDVNAEEESQSLEMKVGTYWLVRIGIVLLLTGLVFLGNYAYQNYFGKFGPWGKLSVLYTISGGLIGAGVLISRKQAKEGLRNYGQVLFGGGLAAVYFTTFGAHYFAPLKVIESAVLAGLLLLGWATFIVFLADRRKSELLAVFALGLAYYTSAITRIGEFTLYSNLVLTTASVFFFIRNKWTNLSLLSLIATYAGFAFWRFYHNGIWFIDPRTENFIPATLFLAAYWILFSIMAFRSSTETAISRSKYATLNNFAFFILTVASMMQQHRGDFWKFSLGFGIVLTGLSYLARRNFADQPRFSTVYLLQGLLLITVGFIAYFTGLALALVLATQSCIMLTAAHLLKNRLMRISAAISAMLAVAWVLSGLQQPAAPHAMGLAISLLLFFNAFWDRNKTRAVDDPKFATLPLLFSGLATFALLVTTWDWCSPILRVPVLAGETAALVLILQWLRTPEIALFGQAMLLLAQAAWLIDITGRGVAHPWWSSASLLACTVGLMHWCEHNKIAALNLRLKQLLAALYSLAAVAISFQWLQPHFTPDQWIGTLAILAFTISIYGAFTRAWWLAGFAQLLVGLSGAQFAIRLYEGNPHWAIASLPIAVVFGISKIISKCLPRFVAFESEVFETLNTLSSIYRWVAALMVLGWIEKYIPVREQFWVLTGLSSSLFVLAGARSNSRILHFSALYFAAGFLAFLFQPWRSGQLVYWPNLIAILSIPALQQFARRRPERYQLSSEQRAFMIFPSGIALWLFVTRWLSFSGVDSYAAFAWCLLAAGFIAASVFFKEPSYRFLGFAAITLSLGKIITLDVWRSTVFWPNLVPILAVIGLQQFERRNSEIDDQAESLHTTLLLAGGVSLWLFVSRAVILQSHGEHFLLTVAWGLLALSVFAAGFLLHERIYRWLGLLILTCGVARVFIFDVWKLETVFRILSFMALGVVLLIIGFIYNRFQDTIRKWL